MCSGQLIHHGQVLFIDTGLSYLKNITFAGEVADIVRKHKNTGRL